MSENVLFISAIQNEPIVQTLFKGDGSIFNGTGYTLGITLTLEHDLQAAIATSAGVAFVTPPGVDGVAIWTPAGGVFTAAACVPGIYLLQWNAAAAGGEKTFDGGRFHLKRRNA